MSQEKLTIKLNASSLKLTHCMLLWHRVVVEGYKQQASPAAMIYGVALHKYIDTMYKTQRPDIARDLSLKEFRKPKYENRKSTYLSDEGHFQVTCMNTWEDHVKKDKDFSLVMLQSQCPWCNGKGEIDLSLPTNSIDDIPVMQECSHCHTEGQMLLPASEVTFSIKYYEDDYVIIILEGTIDGVGKIVNGCYAVRDFKSTSSSEQDEYLDDYEMSSQLRFYIFVIRLMARLHPDSVLGKIGATRVGAFIDGIFLRSKVLNNEYLRSKVFQFNNTDFVEYEVMLNRLIEKLSVSIRTEGWKVREGLLNTACKLGYGKCMFWNVCRSGNEEIAKTLLSRDFIQKKYDPLNHNI